MIKQLVLPLIVLLSAAAATAKQDFPAVSHDGLHLVPNSKVAALYREPGADLSQYDKVALLETYVSFRKNWQRNYNNEASFQSRVSDKDMDRIRKRAAQEFSKVFTEVLSTKGGHEMVSAGGEGVLILRPAIVNLDVAAPDIMSAGISHTVVASAGSLTLYLELYDGKTGAIIARAIDSREAGSPGRARVASSVTNKADFDRVLRHWAELLNDALAAAKN